MVLQRQSNGDISFAQDIPSLSNQELDQFIEGVDEWILNNQNNNSLDPRTIEGVNLIAKQAQDEYQRKNNMNIDPNANKGGFTNAPPPIIKKENAVTLP